MLRVNDLHLRDSGLWYAEAFRLFRAQPFQWVALVALWLLLSLALHLVPLFGVALVTLCQPAFMAGMMIAARDQEAGKLVRSAHLFAAFAFNGRALFMLGSFALLVQGLAVMFLIVMGLPDIKPDLRTPEGLRQLLVGLEGHMWKLAIVLGVTTVYGAIIWFAAPLLAFHAMPATHAMRWSAYAVFSNLLPLLCFAALALIFFMLALLPWALGLLIFVPVWIIAHYVALRRVFSV